MADYSKLTKRELVMTLYARDLMLENERKRLNETIDHYEKYCSEINHQNVMVYAAARNYEDKCKLLQDQLALTEKALELACDKLAYKWCFQMGEDAFCGDCKPCLIDYFKEQVKEMMKSE